MTVKKTISIPDKLDSLIEEFNQRHPFENLILSQIAQKAIFEKIKAEDPALVATMSTITEVAATPSLPAKEIEVEEEHPVQLQGEAQPEPVKKTEYPEKTTSGKEIQCVNCGKKFKAQRSTRKFCSKRCTTAYERKMKKLQS